MICLRTMISRSKIKLVINFMNIIKLLYWVTDMIMETSAETTLLAVIGLATLSNLFFIPQGVATLIQNTADFVIETYFTNKTVD